jgi:D-ornithine 4,5-aminomutase subunit alpha
MTGTARTDDFHTRRRHLQSLSDDELHDRFWQLAAQIVQPLLEEARTHTSPSIERSVLLRMGFSSLEAKPLVQRMQDKGLLGHGAGKLILELAQQKGISVRQAGLGLLDGRYWEELPPCNS